MCNWLLQMAQELGVIERDPDFVNPYKKEAQVPVGNFCADFPLVIHKSCTNC